MIAPHSDIRPLEYNIYWETLNHKLLTLIGLITFVMSLSITFYNSVKSKWLNFRNNYFFLLKSICMSYFCNFDIGGHRRNIWYRRSK